MPKDAWTAGDSYEPYVGRWSRVVARAFLDWLDLPDGLAWIDVGCGTGALTSTIIELASPREVLGVEPAEAFLAHARATVTDPRARFEEGDAQELPSPDDAFDAAVSGLVLNFVPEPARAAEQMTRVVHLGGTVAAYVWDYAGRMELMRAFWDAAVALDPEARDLDEGVRFPLCNPEALTQLLEAAGLADVHARAIDVPTIFRDFDDYWMPFLGGQGPAPGYAMSLSDDRRELIREHIRSSLPIEPDGTIRLTARAWAVRGIRSGAR